MRLRTSAAHTQFNCFYHSVADERRQRHGKITNKKANGALNNTPGHQEFITVCATEICAIEPPKHVLVQLLIVVKVTDSLTKSLLDRQEGGVREGSRGQLIGNPSVQLFLFVWPGNQVRNQQPSGTR